MRAGTRQKRAIGAPAAPLSEFSRASLVVVARRRGRALLLSLLLTACSWQPRNPSDVTAQRLRDLKSPDAETRANAALYLRFSPTPRDKRWSVPALAKALDDADEKVKFNAYESLVDLTGNSTLPRKSDAWLGWWAKMVESYDASNKPPEDEVRKMRATMHSEEAVLLMAQGNFRGAETRLVQAVHLDPEQASYHVNLAKCYINMRRFEDALNKSLDAIRINPDLPEAYANEGEAYEGLGKSYEAITAYKEALSREDRKRKDWHTRYRLARLYLKSNMLEEAAGSIREALEVNPRQPQLHVSAALIYYAREEYYAAWQEVEKVRELGYDWRDQDFTKKLQRELRRMGMDFPEDDSQQRPPPALREPGLDVLLSPPATGGPSSEKPEKPPVPAPK